MYVTRPLSIYRKSPEALSEPPGEGPGTGFLVIQDEEIQNFCCFGLLKTNKVYEFPFPQNKSLTVRFTQTYGPGMVAVYCDNVMMVPVLGQPLSSNKYYVIRRDGKHNGEAHASSKNDDVAACLCFGCVSDVKPTPLDPLNMYQQFSIHHGNTLCWRCGFSAESVASGGYPPRFLSRNGWSLHAKTPKSYHLHEDAIGVNHKLRAKLPSFDFSSDRKSSEALVVGKWYCPFMFIKDGEVGDQIKKSPYYEMTLNQRWEQIFARDNYPSGGNTNSVAVDVHIQTEAISVFGQEAVADKVNGVSEGVIWFRRCSDKNGVSGHKSAIGLSMAIVDRMMWEQERVGWVSSGDEKEKKVRVEGAEEFKDAIKGGTWKTFGRYVLVERFVLKRMDGTTVLTYDFKHTHQVRSKWE